MSVWVGLPSWGLAGIALALLLRLLPRCRGAGWLVSLALGLTGALVGGGLATALGFGGLAGFDVRALATAALASLLALLLLALGRDSRRRPVPAPRQSSPVRPGSR